ncbi:MAG TPA: NADH-quinone oxidoreductase subunit J [Caldisericia bacterium]|nr:NADH-quinone oxidoreductase subunit J [Caldisericia bacterium]HPF49046.1 NADH-quinone oxidoreductase subunit J [Caldisericia bacterium]HPI83090.1 NADH-quinone oxidoreductase subunit J [Caldisericia bacterium]HPQ92317.1 NADH-quinone oxidoreductase subunit J [Caldisericia bacterium]HRV74585.1 NADH-quinone oxidoreductase subunit J [Caldisericia bacterium]
MTELWPIILISVPVIVFALLTVTLRNIMHAILSLILCLLSLALVYVLVGADFIAAAQVAIYVGAISILILFAIMFTRDKEGKQLVHIHRQYPIGIVVALCLLVMVSFFIYKSDVDLTTLETNHGYNSVEGIGKTMYGIPGSGKPTEYSIPVEMASFMLLAALVGGVEMAKKKEDEV